MTDITNLWKQNLGKVPDDVWQQTRVSVLILADNSLTELSPQIGRLQRRHQHFLRARAVLFLAGLWFSFGDPDKAEDTWALMTGLAGYTLLLSATAVRLGP